MLAALIALPYLGALTLAAIPARREAAVRTVAAVAATVAAVLAFAALLAVPPGPATETHRLVERAVWIPGIGAEWFVGVDGIRAPSLLVVTLVGLAAILFDRVPSRGRLAALLVLTASLAGVVASLDLLLLSTFLATALLAAATFGGAGRHLVPGSLAASAALVLAAALVAVRAETLDLTVLAVADPFHGAPVQQAILHALLLVGFAVPAGLFPFHRPLAAAVECAPAPGAALLAGGLGRVASLGILVVAMPLAPAAAARSAGLLALLGVAGILAGALRAGRAASPRALAASLVPVQAGLAALAAAAVPARPDAAAGFLLLLVGHGLGSAALVLAAESVAVRGSTGLLRASPLLGALVAAAAAAAVGLPGTPAFPGTLLGLAGAAAAHPWLAVAAAAGTVLAGVAVLRATARRLLGEPAPGAAGPGAAEAAALVLLATQALLFGVLPSLLLLRAAGPLGRLVAGLAGGG